MIARWKLACSAICRSRQSRTRHSNSAMHTHLFVSGGAGRRGKATLLDESRFPLELVAAVGVLLD